MVKDLNRVLFKYNITNPNSIRHFITQCTHETYDWNNATYGTALIEIGPDSYLTTQAYWPYVGGGYIHLTWKENYEKFSTYIKDPLILFDNSSVIKSQFDALFKTRGPGRIANNYAWESAAWFWGKLKSSLNKISQQNGSTITKVVRSDNTDEGPEPRARTGNSVVFDVGYAVNGGYNGIDSRLKIYEVVKNIIK